MKKLSILLLAVFLTAALTACSQQSDAAAPAPETETETPAKETELAELEALLGVSDDESKDNFGGSEENWTEDGSYFIGRIFNLTLEGRPATLYTSYDKDERINSVSVWLTDEEDPATDELTEEWVGYLSTYAGSEPAYDNTTSEAGSKIWKWNLDGAFMKLYRTGDILSFTMNPAVGELK